jgi:integrase/recombinase XerD
MAIKRKRTMAYQRSQVPIEHTGFHAYLQRYLEAMLMRNYSQSTLRRRESDIRRFVGWCETYGLDQPHDITKPILERYQKHLYYYRQENGEPLSFSSQGNYLAGLRQFFKWLTQENYLLYNPASELIIPKRHARLPVVLSPQEVEKLMLQPNIHSPYGLRDRAILELLYSTGLRRTELINLQQHDINFEQQTLYVRQGKGGKDRLLPMGQRASHWLNRYLNEVRPQLLIDLADQHLFLSDYGSRFRDTKLGDRVKRYMKKAGITAPGSCHLLRHAMATHMLENGAELRFIQAMLGHADFKSTQIYTHVSISKLQEIHANTHPAKLEDKAALILNLAAEADD